ncbi:hypothetical protein CDV36_002635 [Fusarium kuroshium]|uniref:Uncharacterized protein n=2 Tax=Fusarium solani species complex TaxID=232080 RepID=A0A3M2SJG3_9HYPO|nr:hypothetical protein CDV36_002635 [Fusarium kuroshium]RSL94289.1 hypothetical protein CEP52_012692 [Fusarium oligoseptatum]
MLTVGAIRNFDSIQTAENFFGGGSAWRRERPVQFQLGATSDDDRAAPIRGPSGPETTHSGTNPVKSDSMGTDPSPSHPLSVPDEGLTLSNYTQPLGFQLLTQADSRAQPDLAAQPGQESMTSSPPLPGEMTSVTQASVTPGRFSPLPGLDLIGELFLSAQMVFPGDPTLGRSPPTLGW